MDLCIFCNAANSNECCKQKTKQEKYVLILAKMEKLVKLIEENEHKTNIINFCAQLRSLDILTDIQINSDIKFDPHIHKQDLIAQNYLNFCDVINCNNFVAVETLGDGNCLYNSVLKYINNEQISVCELRVRTIISMIENWELYESLYINFLGPIYIHIKQTVYLKNYSELYELIALCDVLKVNIQSVYPKIHNPNQNNISQWITHNQVYFNRHNQQNMIYILWTHIQEEKLARNNNIYKTWSPNHFVPLFPRNENHQINTSPIESILPETNQNINAKDAKKEADKQRKANKRQHETTEEKLKRNLKAKEYIKTRRKNESLTEIKNRREKEKNRSRLRRATMDKIDSKYMKRARKEEPNQMENVWPLITSEDTKYKLLSNFLQKMSQNNLIQKICGICNCLEYATKMHITPMDRIPNFNSLIPEDDSIVRKILAEGILF